MRIIFFSKGDQLDILKTGLFVFRKKHGSEFQTKKKLENLVTKRIVYKTRIKNMLSIFLFLFILII
jgi:hypothetical protein